MGRAEDLFERIEGGGEQAIDELIAARTSEELFLDFKRSSDNGAGLRLSDRDRNNFARAISGFGNSEGGVIVWGIDCSLDEVGADIAKTKVLIQDAKRFVSWLEGAISGCTVPPHIGVRSIAITSAGRQEGFAVTIVPKSNHAPHQVVGLSQYFIRAGSSFVPTPHGVLAGMFGRSPQPHVFHTYNTSLPEVRGDGIHGSTAIMIRNDGPGVANDLFISLMVHSFPTGNSSIAYERTDPENWGGAVSFGTHISLISQPTLRLAPESQAQPLVLNFCICPPIDRKIEIRGVVGAGNSLPYRINLVQSIPAILAAYDRVMRAHHGGTLTSEMLHQFTKDVFGHSTES